MDKVPVWPFRAYLSRVGVGRFFTYIPSDVIREAKF